VRARLAELLDQLPPPPDASEPADVKVHVLFAPALDETDALAGRWLARIGAARGVEATFASPLALASELVDQAAAESPAAVCVSALTPRGVAQARNLCKRLALAKVDCDRIVGCWAAPLHEQPAPLAECTAVVATARALDAILQSVRARGAA